MKGELINGLKESDEHEFIQKLNVINDISNISNRINNNNINNNNNIISNINESRESIGVNKINTNTNHNVMINVNKSSTQFNQIDNILKSGNNNFSDEKNNRKIKINKYNLYNVSVNLKKICSRNYKRRY